MVKEACFSSGKYSGLEYRDPARRAQVRVRAEAQPAGVVLTIEGNYADGVHRVRRLLGQVSIASDHISRQR